MNEIFHIRGDTPRSPSSRQQKRGNRVFLYCPPLFPFPKFFPFKWARLDLRVEPKDPKKKNPLFFGVFGKLGCTREGLPFFFPCLFFVVFPAGWYWGGRRARENFIAPRGAVAAPRRGSGDEVRGEPPKGAGDEVKSFAFWIFNFPKIF